MTTLPRPALTRVAGLAALCAAGAVAVPATASAASTSIVAGPLKVKDYAMTVTASDAARDSFSVMFTRRAGKATQSHYYAFGGVKVTADKALSAARIKGGLGRYGKVDLKLTGPGAVKRGKTPKGCTGKAGRLRAGTLKGTFSLAADSSYFGTVSAKALKAQLARGGRITCDTGGSGGSGSGGAGETMLTSTSTGSDGMLMLSVIRDASGAITQQAMRTDDAAATAPASVMHIISAPGGGSAFAPAGDLSSATGTGVSPFLSGAFAFTADTPMPGMATGTLSGDLAARFDSIGTQQLAAGSPTAMLMQR